MLELTHTCTIFTPNVCAVGTWGVKSFQRTVLLWKFHLGVNLFNWDKCFYRLFGNEREFINGRCRTISGHFFANCINIFHKTEVQTVILMCLMSQNLNLFKRYDTKCTLRPRKILAKSEIDHQNFHLINGHFATMSGHFWAN